MKPDTIQLIGRVLLEAMNNLTPREHRMIKRDLADLEGAQLAGDIPLAGSILSSLMITITNGMTFIDRRPKPLPPGPRRQIRKVLEAASIAARN